MSKDRLVDYVRDCEARGDLSFCFDVQFRPEGTLFTQIETPYSVLVPFDLPEAGEFLFDVGQVFHTLPKETQEGFHHCILLFTEWMLNNPHEHVKHAFSDAAKFFFQLLAAEKNGEVVIDKDGDGITILRNKPTSH